VAPMPGDAYAGEAGVNAGLAGDPEYMPPMLGDVGLYVGDDGEKPGDIGLARPAVKGLVGL
jgi:hypothetical protein